MLFVVSCISSFSQSKRTIDFDDDWRFQRYGLQSDGKRIEEPIGLKSPRYKVFDDTGWRIISVPHDWGIEGPFREELDGYTGKLPWRGIGWYRKSLYVDSADSSKMFFLDFDGVMANSEIYLNGIKIGEHPYGYTSFRVDLTPHLLWGEENVIAVRVDTENLGSRWYPGAGIYRHVRLVKTNKINIPQWGIFVTTPKISMNSALVSTLIAIDNRSDTTANVKTKIDIFRLKDNGDIMNWVTSKEENGFVIPPLSVDTSKIELNLDSPHLWGLRNRNMYLARVSIYEKGILTDTEDVHFGIRTIEFTHNNGFLLNGERVQIKGVCMHHDLGALGTAVNISAIERQLKILKSFGANAIRTSHNPPAPELLDLADRLGMLIVDEAFDCWTYGKNENDYSSLYKKWHHEDIRAWICRDRNHPSVIMWSLGNEVEEQYHPELGIVSYLRDIVRMFDKSRPVTFGASYPSKSALNGTELQVDVHGMNYPSGVYGGPDFYGQFLEYPGHESLCGYASETSSTLSSRGVYFPRGYHVSSYDLTEPGWGALPDEEFAALEKYPSICGEFVWTGFDYLGEPTPFNSDRSVLLNYASADENELEKRKNELVQIEKERPTSRSSYFGIVDLAGFPKDRYFLYKAHWMPEVPFAHIIPHWNFPDRVGKVTPVFVYSTGDEVELFLNGISLGKKVKGRYEYRFKWEDVKYVPGELKAIAYKKGKVWAKDSIKTTGEAISLYAETDRNRINSEKEELAFITVKILDSEGLIVPIADNLIKCRLEGEGMIVATDNGDPTCLVPFYDTERKAFNGYMLVIVRANKGKKGKLKLIIESNGLIGTSIEVEAY